MNGQTRTTSVISLSLPPSLLREAMRWAKKEDRTKSELFREALRFYMREEKWNELRRYGTKRARELGITAKDVQRLIQEHRHEQRANKGRRRH